MKTQSSAEMALRKRACNGQVNEKSAKLCEKKFKQMKKMAKKASPKKRTYSAEDLQEQFEAELDIALLYVFEIFDRHKKALNTYTDYTGNFDDGPSFNIVVNTDKKGKLKSADINMEFKNLEKFVRSLKV
ncbi:MAG: hypothetical protein HY958_00895 [Bacteroidia bacterium]|nr:hypothetical protein [Bacteroidia bacterium]